LKFHNPPAAERSGAPKLKSVFPPEVRLPALRL